jgi:DNA-binding response OmpR family regulator
MRRVLLIDDDSTVRSTIALTLVSLGFEPISVGSAIEGIERAEQDAFDVVLVDINMPGVDGLEVVKAIARLARPVPLIAMSGGSTERDYAVLTRAMGARQFLVKPFRRHELLAAIDTATSCQTLNRTVAR